MMGSRLASGLLLAIATALMPVVPATRAAGDECCSCAFSATETFSAGDKLPCIFDHPKGWDSQEGDDGASVAGIVGKPSCSTPCTGGSSGMTVMIAKRPNPNAQAMEEAWPQVMEVAGSARCAGETVTFFQTPGSEPAGQIGGLRFHVGFGGERYSGTATFTCPVPGEWPSLQDLFINSFRTNEGTTFGEG